MRRTHGVGLSVPRSAGLLRALGFAQDWQKCTVLPGASLEETWRVVRAEPSLL